VAFDPPIDAGGLDWGFWYRAGPPLEAAPFYRLPRRTADTSSTWAKKGYHASGIWWASSRWTTLSVF